VVAILINNFIPVVITVVLVLLVAVVLAFLLRERASGERPLVDREGTQKPREVKEDSVNKENDLPPAEGQDFGLRLVLDDDRMFYLELPTTIGRSEDNAIVMDDDSVSAHHARIFYDERLGAVCIKDLETVNGIFIDGRPTVMNVLDDGARLTFGSFSLTFRDTGYLPPT
jgi:hypothetical protein